MLPKEERVVRKKKKKRCYQFNGESSKQGIAKADRVSQGNLALESSLKRQSLHLAGRNTNGGEPTLEDKTSGHLHFIGVGA